MQSKLNTARIHKESQRREKTIYATRKVSKNNIQVEKESRKRKLYMYTL